MDDSGPEEQVIFGLGANQGDVESTLLWALGQLASEFGPLTVASPYRTRPISEVPQPDYLNTVAAGRLSTRSARSPRDLLGLLKELEAAAGRPAEGARPHHGPRPLDLDLLLLGSSRVNLSALNPGSDMASVWGTTVGWPGAVVVPHPRMLERRFVLEPLAEILPGLRLDGRSVLEHLESLRGGDGAAQGVERLAWSRPPTTATSDGLPSADSVD